MYVCENRWVNKKNGIINTALQSQRTTERTADK